MQIQRSLLAFQQKAPRLCVLHIIEKQLLLTFCIVTAEPSCAARAGHSNMLLSGRGKRPKVRQRGHKASAAANPCLMQSGHATQRTAPPPTDRHVSVHDACLQAKSLPQTVIRLEADSLHIIMVSRFLYDLLYFVGEIQDIARAVSGSTTSTAREAPTTLGESEAYKPITEVGQCLETCDIQNALCSDQVCRPVLQCYVLIWPTCLLAFRWC